MKLSVHGSFFVKPKVQVSQARAASRPIHCWPEMLEVKWLKYEIFKIKWRLLRPGFWSGVWIKWSLRGKFLKGKEKLQFQRVFLEIFGLLKPGVVWKMWIFLCSYWTNKCKIYFYKCSKLWRTTCTLQNCFSLSEWRLGGFLVKLSVF